MITLLHSISRTWSVQWNLLSFGEREDGCEVYLLGPVNVQNIAGSTFPFYVKDIGNLVSVMDLPSGPHHYYIQD